MKENQAKTLNQRVFLFGRAAVMPRADAFRRSRWLVAVDIPI
jgi:hypothetical protein